MKKLYFLIAVAALLLSCTKPTTVQVVNNGSFFNGSGGLNGTLYNATLILYKGNDLVGQVNLGDITYGGGKSKIVEVEDYVEKAKLMFKFFPSTTTYSNPFKYTSQFYILSSNKDNQIVITDQTLISNSNKSNYTLTKDLMLTNQHATNN